MEQIKCYCGHTTYCDCGPLPKQTLEEAAEKWVFETNEHKWSNNDDTAGDNYGSFKAGAKWMEDQMEKLKDFDTWKEWKNKLKSE